MDWSTLTDEELATTVEAGQAEIARRAREQHVITELEQVQQSALAAKGWSDGDEWLQPAGTHDAYPVGARATHDGRTWVNELASNPFPPGVTGWREEVTEGEYPVWWQPLGAHDAHVWGTGTRAWHDGTLWESMRDQNVWPPEIGDDYWVEVNDEEPGPGEPEEPEHPEWVRPTGAHDAYSIDDTVIYQGCIWRSRIDANTWSPTEHPAGWEHIGDV